MTRAGQIVEVLLEAEDAFDPRAYLMDPDARTTDVLNAIKKGLESYYQSVDIFPAVEGTAAWAKFFHGGNRYRIRCKRSGPRLRVSQKSGWDGNSAAQNQRIKIEEFIKIVAEKHGYYINKLAFSGSVYSNLLIIIDMWPYDQSDWKKNQSNWKNDET